jgi:hypothetical protein
MRLNVCLVAFLLAAPIAVRAQPGVDVNVNVGVDADDSYDTTAPGDPVDNVDVFYDQLSPYGTWVDEPDAGRVFIPEQTDYVPYQHGHWQYTSLGMVWVGNEPYGWATSHYGRWAYSPNYGRWVWVPDTTWGPAWVEWRQTGTHFGWAPMAPDVYVRVGYVAPVEVWRYCPAERILDVNVVRYYEPRERVVVIQREARPIVHYTTVNNVRVVVGPGAAVFREHRVVVARPAKIEAKAIGRWSPAEARAQVVRAQENKATFEAQNARRIQANPRISAAHAKVIEAHPQIKAQVDTRVQVKVDAHATAAAHAAPAEHAPPAHAAPAEHAPPEHAAPAVHAPPMRAAPAEHAPPVHAAPAEHAPPVRAAPAEHAPQVHAAPAEHAPPVHAAPAEHAPPASHAPPAGHAPPPSHAKER